MQTNSQSGVYCSITGKRFPDIICRRTNNNAKIRLGMGALRKSAVQNSQEIKRQGKSNNLFGKRKEGSKPADSLFPAAAKRDRRKSRLFLHLLPVGEKEH